MRVQERDRLPGVVDDPDQQVVEQVAAHGQVDHRVDADLLEVGGGADARSHEQLRRVERAGRDDDLARVDPLPAARGRPALDAAHRAARVDDQALDDGVRHDLEVASIEDRCEERAIRVLPAAVHDRGAVPPAPVEGAGVEVGVERQARLDGRVDEDLGERVALREVARAQVPFELLEGRPHLVPAPARAAARGPAVVVLRRAAQVDHAVEAARPAEHAPARQDVPSPGGAALGHGLVLPVHGAAPEVEVLVGVRDLGVVVRAAGLQHQHGDVLPVGEPPSERTAGGSGSDDDDVVAPAHRSSTSSVMPTRTWPAGDRRRRP